VMESVVQQKEGSANANDGTDSESNSRMTICLRMS
jgi:hypothetical protein